jgi:hypothetical protein
MTEEKKVVPALERFAHREQEVVVPPNTPAAGSIKVGQVWAEVDPRGGRNVTVKAVAEGETHAITVESAGVYKQIYQVNRSHFGSPHGYKLIKDVP